MAGDAPRPDAPLRTDTFKQRRPDIVGEDAPVTPYPIRLSGRVAQGFGRGGKDLGCPTANLDEESLVQIPPGTPTGIYFGFARVLTCPDPTIQPLADADHKVWPMVMSLGRNPYYRNQKLSAEVHILHDFTDDFYRFPMKVLILGYIRPELDYTSREDLIDDIEKDKSVGLKSLDRPSYALYREDAFFNNSQL